MESTSYFIALSLGFFGGAHCLGMCGGIMGAMTLAIDRDNRRQRVFLVLVYNVGRIASYVSIAVVFYLLIAVPANYFFMNFMRMLAGLLLIAMGLYLANWWRGLSYLERVGGLLWSKIQPLTQALLPVRTARQALFLGALWGWLPCGLVYSALVYSATANSVSQAALLMFSFALGTLPAVLSGSLVLDRILEVSRKKSLRALMGILLLSFGFWTLWTTFEHHSHESGSAIPEHPHHH